MIMKDAQFKKNVDGAPSETLMLDDFLSSHDALVSERLDPPREGRTYNLTENLLKQLTPYPTVHETISCTSDENTTVTALLLSTLKMITESPLPSVSTAENDRDFSSTASTKSFDLDAPVHGRPLSVDSLSCSSTCPQDYAISLPVTYSQTVMDSNHLLDRWNLCRKNRNCIFKTSCMPLSSPDVSAFSCTSLVNDLLSHDGQVSVSDFVPKRDTTLYSVIDPSLLLGLETTDCLRNTFSMTDSDSPPFLFDNFENECCVVTQSFDPSVAIDQGAVHSTLPPVAQVQNHSVDPSAASLTESIQSPTWPHGASGVVEKHHDSPHSSVERGKKTSGSHGSESTSLHLNYSRPGNGPTYWGMWEDERSRMVYVSWLPRAARANDRGEKKQREVHLKHFIADVLGFSGLLKVLLFPPASAHCKLLFSSEETARCFLETFGTIKGSDGAALWKSLVCQHFRVNMQYGINATHVRIIWADQTKTDSELLCHSMTSSSPRHSGPSYTTSCVLPMSPCLGLQHTTRKT